MKTIKYLLAWPVAHAFYYLGDWVSRLIDVYAKLGEHFKFIDEEGNSVVIDKLYPVYGWFMMKSIQVDDWGSIKIWSVPTKG